MAQEKDLIINNFQTGIADSPFLGIAAMKNLNTLDRPGAIQLNTTLQQVSASTKVATFTAVAATDVITVASTFEWLSHGATGRAVTVSSSGTLPAGLSAATTYFIIDTGTLTMKLATSYANALAGTAIDITTAGSGTHTMTSVDIAIPRFFTKDSNSGTVFMQDSLGQIWQRPNNDWYLVNGNTLTNATGNGLAIYKGYLFAFRNAAIDVAPVSNPYSWTNAWQNLNASGGDQAYHGAVTGQDDILYIADRNTTSGTPYIVAINELVGTTFDPTNVATYNYNSKALTLPNYKTITCLEELGVNLMIGTIGREIYPWDRSSTTFALPVIAAEDGITAMRNLNNVLYFAAGSRGNLYSTLGSYTTFERRLAPYLTSIPNNNVNIASMTAHRGRLLFTVECVGCSGIYSYDPLTRALNFENIISANVQGTSNPLKLHCIYSLGAEQYLVGWANQDSSIYGIDSNFYSAYLFSALGNAYLESPIYKVGTPNNKKQFQSTEIQFAQLFPQNCVVALYWRRGLSDAYTLIGSVDGTQTYDTGIYSKEMPFTGDALDTVQIKAIVTANPQGTSTPSIMEMRLR